MSFAHIPSVPYYVPLVEHIPEAEAAQGVTLRHHLSHTSGLKDTLRGFLAVHFPDQSPPTTAQALRRYRIVAAHPPGTMVEYRNVNYALLGEVVSRMLYHLHSLYEILRKF